MSVAGGGILALGSGIAALASGATTFASAAIFGYEVDSTNVGVLSTSADLLVVSGGLNLDTGNGTLLTFFDLNGTPNPFVEDSTVCAMINYTGAWNGGGLRIARSMALPQRCPHAFSSRWADAEAGVAFSGTRTAAPGTAALPPLRWRFSRVGADRVSVGRLGALV